MANFISLPFSSIPVWHRIKFQNEELYGKKTLNVVNAHPQRLNSRQQVIQASHFDVALIQANTQDSNTHEYLKGMRLGRVRVIFSLPENTLDKIFPANVTPPPAHLAYVEWFSKFTRSPEPYLGLFKVRRDVLNNGSRNASAVPLEMIRHSVHLFPKWGG
ncbi:hypothetical protein K435DRAFT_876086 [Dendrothele bispora CBS 962.96]|uniref:Uncharacterized protein n=1 Tax=Dendrothele bispora (strain CBS 962.96) TaxID=1314807 RepID=A0A4S8KT73_DENBC|nr:hypothetical protein K435DRAFT_876086 [Dendrothele bispora CBS 962.96]